jgi:hypothetical protein
MTSLQMNTIRMDLEDDHIFKRPGHSSKPVQSSKPVPISYKLKKVSFENDTDDEESEEEEESPKSKNDKNKTDFMKATGNLLSNINYKMAFILFFICMLIFSDIFIENVLSRFSDSVHGETTTSKGTVIQLLFVVLFYIIFDVLIKYEVI